MKTKIIILLAIFVAVPAFADITALSAKFAGGGTIKNTEKASVVARATGSDFSSDTLQIQHSKTKKGPWKNVSNHSRSVSDSGVAKFEFRNKAGCYRVVTAANGNDVADVVSNKICEK